MVPSVSQHPPWTGPILFHIVMILLLYWASVSYQSQPPPLILSSLLSWGWMSSAFLKSRKPDTEIMFLTVESSLKKNETRKKEDVAHSIQQGILRYSSILRLKPMHRSQPKFFKLGVQAESYVESLRRKALWLENKITFFVFLYNKVFLRLLMGW